MEKAVSLLNTIFEMDLEQEDWDKDIDEIIMWNSFEILEFCVRVEEKLKVKVVVDDLLEVVTVRELISVVDEWIKLSEIS